MKWYIGQPIVAIKNHRHGRFKKGQEFIIMGLTQKQCCDKIILIDIGVGITTHCSTCGSSSGFAGYSSNLFAPLDVDISELTEILTNENQATL